MKAWIFVAAIGVALAGVGVPAAASTRQSRTAGGSFAVTYEASGGSEHYQGDVFGDAVCIDGNENVPGRLATPQRYRQPGCRGATRGPA